MLKVFKNQIAGEKVGVRQVTCRNHINHMCCPMALFLFLFFVCFPYYWSGSCLLEAWIDMCFLSWDVVRYFILKMTKTSHHRAVSTTYFSCKWKIHCAVKYLLNCGKSIMLIMFCFLFLSDCLNHIVFLCLWFQQNSVHHLLPWKTDMFKLVIKDTFFLYIHGSFQVLALYWCHNLLPPSVMKQC